MSKNHAGVMPDNVHDEQMSEFVEKESILRRQHVQHEQTVFRTNEHIEDSSKVFVRIASDCFGLVVIGSTNKTIGSVLAFLWLST